MVTISKIRKKGNYRESNNFEYNFRTSNNFEWQFSKGFESIIMLLFFWNKLECSYCTV